MSPGKKSLRLQYLIVMSDLTAIAVSFAITYTIRFLTFLIPVTHQPNLIDYARSLAVVAPVYILFFRAYGLYQTSRHIRRIEEIFLVIKAVSFSILTLMALTFFYRGFSYSRLFLVILWLVSIFCISTLRYFLIEWEYLRKIQRKEITRVLLVGANRNARSIVQWAKNNHHYGHEVVAVLSRDPELVGKHVEGVSIIGTCDEAEKTIDELKPDRVVLLDATYPRDRITDLVVTCDDLSIDFKVGADMYGLLSRNVDVEYISTVPLLGFRPLPLDDFWNRLIKRVFDVSASLFFIAAAAPFWLVIMIMIKLDDGGPLLYKQDRMGRDQKVFNLLKFRTMKTDAEAKTGPVWAKPNDSRRTRIGNFLRRWNLDELPQLWNVFVGDMSMVGPRPERPHFISQFRESIPRYMARHKVKSGITGWAQVNGYRGNTSIQERTKYDLYYMENWSLLFDIEIIIMTFSAFKNAY